MGLHLVVKKGEDIIINDDIFVKVLECDGRQVKLDITAPADIPVHRRKVWERIQRGDIER